MMFKFRITFKTDYQHDMNGVFTKEIEATLLADAWTDLMASLGELGLLNSLISIERI